MRDGPSPANAIGSAISWLESTLLGTVATAVAVIAVASVGLLMLTGRIDLRRGGRVVLGGFILFGASTIAAGIHSAANGLNQIAPPIDSAEEAAMPPPPAYPDSAPAAYDPYAGAALAPRP